MHGNKPDRTVPENGSAAYQLNRQELLTIWQGDFGANPPPHLSLGFLKRAVAFERQLKTGSTSERRIICNIDRLALKGDRGKRCSDKSEMSEGSQLIREWNGVVHKVDVIDGGYVYLGKTYKSLSAIAREITGTRWSGPRFFGVKG